MSAILIDDNKITKCKRCGRKLKNVQAIEVGMGPTCFRKWKKEDNHKKLWEVKNET